MTTKEIRSVHEVKNQSANLTFKIVKLNERPNSIYSGSLHIYEALEYAAEQDKGAQLWSAREAAAFIIEDKQKFHPTYITRTAAIYFHFGSEYYAAFDDQTGSFRGLILSAAFPYLLRTESRPVKNALKRAEKAGRIVKVTEGIQDLETRTKNGKSAFGQHDWPKAILLDMAEPYANKCYKAGVKEVCVVSIGREELEKNKINNYDENRVKIDFVTLAHRSNIVASIDAGTFFEERTGVACAVANPPAFSPNKRIVELSEDYVATKRSRKEQERKRYF